MDGTVRSGSEKPRFSRFSSSHSLLDISLFVNRWSLKEANHRDPAISELLILMTRKLPRGDHPVPLDTSLQLLFFSSPGVLPASTFLMSPLLGQKSSGIRPFCNTFCPSAPQSYPRLPHWSWVPSPCSLASLPRTQRDGNHDG